MKHLLSFLLLFISVTAFSQTTYYSKGNLPQNLVASWNSDPDGVSGTQPGNFTTSGDIFIVQGLGGQAGAPHTMVSSSTLVVGANVTFIIEDGAVIQANNTFTMNATSIFQINNGGRYANNHTNAHPLQGTEVFAPTSIYEILASNSTFTPAGSNISFGHLIINSSGTTAINAQGGINSIQGNFTVLGTGTGSFTFASTQAYTTNIAGNIMVQGGLLRSNSTTVAAGNPQVMNVGGSVTVSGGAFNIGTSASPQVSLNVTGDFTVNGGIFNGSGNSATVATTTINGSLYVSSGSFATTSSTGTSTVHVLQNAEVSGGVLSISSITNTGGTFQLTIDGNVTLTGGTFGNTAGSAYTISIGGDLNINTGALYQWAGLTTSTRATTLQLAGNFNMTGGTFDGNTNVGTGASIIRFTGAAKTFTQSGGTFTSNLSTQVASGASTTWNAPYTIPPTRSMLVAGTANLNNQSFVFESTNAGTARLESVTGTITGATNVTVERFIGMPAPKRAWRLLTTPLRAAATEVSIYTAWQNAGAMTAGDGTLITSPNATAGDGMDATSIGHSLKSYNANVLTGVENTMTTPLFTSAPSAANKSYFLFVRGDRSVLDLTNVTTTTLTPTGTLQTGTQTFAASSVAGEFSLVGNPYPSPVDFNLVNKSNLINRFYTWDPSLNVVGGYVLVDDATNTGIYTITPNPDSAVAGTSAQNQHIQSSQAFFVQTAANGVASLTFEETDKSAVNINNVFRTGNGSDERLRVNLFLNNSDNTTTLADGIAAHFNTGFSSNVDLMDGPKMENIHENMSFARSGQMLTLERRPLINATDTLFINLANTTARNYSFNIDGSNFSDATLTAFFEDSYLQTSTPLNLNGVTNINFTVTTDAASAVANRFMVVFKTSGVLPVNFTNVKAYKQNAGITVEWNVATEQGIVGYEVEKSADGRSFSKAGTVEARNNNAATYTWLDANVFAGNNFYRIKAIENNGNAKYSSVVNVRNDKAGMGVVVYPNPVKGNTIKMQMNNQREGNYTIQLFNAVGQEVFRTIVSHSGVSSAQTVSLPSSVENGIYQLVIKGNDYSSTHQLVISK